LIVSSLLALKTTSLNRQEVALYMWMMTCLRPATASNVFLIRSALAGVRTYSRVNRHKSTRESTHLDPDIIWDLFPVDELSDKVEVWLRGSWVRDLDFLEANLD
jgi:hypothetical protein